MRVYLYTSTYVTLYSDYIVRHNIALCDITSTLLNRRYRMCAIRDTDCLVVVVFRRLGVYCNRVILYHLSLSLSLSLSLPFFLFLSLWRDGAPFRALLATGISATMR